MNPHQKNKIDVSTLSPEEQRLFRLYGKLPSRSDHFAKHLKDRKYFDSGDYAMSKAGKGDGVDTGSVGSQHPVPENIPHNNSSNNVGGTPGLNKSGSMSSASGVGGIMVGSPAKESSSGLQRETSAEEAVEDQEARAAAAAAAAADKGDDGSAAGQQGIPIRS